MSQKIGYIAIDQYGKAYPILEHPRKELLALLGATHAEKMYGGSPKARHIGYVISGLWLTISELHNWRNAHE